MGAPLAGRGGAPEKDGALWCEQRLVLTVVKRIFLETATITGLFEHMHRVAVLCAKWEALPAHYRYYYERTFGKNVGEMANRGARCCGLWREVLKWVHF
jgi:hypothetical protein